MINTKFSGAVLFIICITSITACRNVSSGNKKEYIANDGHKIKMIFYPDGKAKSKYSYLQDTILDGLQIDYYEDGAVKKRGFYKNGLKDSITYIFYPNAVLFEKSTWYMNIPFGERIEYSPTGAIKSYEYYSPDGSLSYQKKYDSLGKALSEDGNHIAATLENKSLSEYKLGDTIIHQVFVVRPPKIENTFETKFYRIGDDFNDKWGQVFLNNEGSYNYTYILKDKGRYVLAEKLIIYDSLSNDNKAMRVQYFDTIEIK